MHPKITELAETRKAGVERTEEEVQAELRAAYTLVDLIVSDERVYRATCGKGHELVWVLFNPKHELLFELGAHAVLDGYYREAVANFAAALERFYEFHTRLLMARAGLSTSDVDATWKHVASQSERQLGAFLFTAVVAYGKPVDMKPVFAKTSFRNDVIHKGAFPSREHTLEYGETVRTFICERLKDLMRIGADPFVYQQDVVVQPRCAETKGTSHGSATLINLGHVHNPDFGQWRLRDRLADVARYRKDFYPPEPSIGEEEEASPK